jgi:tetrahydromethanopterin S-methyltransferase subunit G
MYNALGIIYGIIVGVAIIVFLDWLAERKDRRSGRTTR